MSRIQEYIRNVRRLSAHRSYRRLLVGGAVSALGDRVGYIAFLGAVGARSHDILAFGAITIAEVLPAIVAVPVVSLIIDRFDKRRLMFWADLVRALMFAVAAIAPELWMLYVAAFVSASFTVLFEPARQALEPHYVPEGELAQAGGLRMGVISGVMICGPALGGLLVAAFGYAEAFAFNAASFLISAWMVSDLDAVQREREAHKSAWHEILGGIRAVNRSGTLKFLFAMFGAFLLVVGIQFPLLYVFVEENLKGSTSEAGLIFSMIGIGGLLCGAALASLGKERKLFDARELAGKRSIIALVALDGLIVVVLGAVNSLAPAMLIFAFFGFIGTGLHTAFQAAVAAEASDELRGRIFALNSAINGPLIVISIFLGIPLAREYGASAVFFGSGGLEIVVAVVAFAVAGRARSIDPGASTQ